MLHEGSSNYGCDVTNKNNCTFDWPFNLQQLSPVYSQSGKNILLFLAVGYQMYHHCLPKDPDV